MSPQGINQAVQRLVRDRLPLVAAARQDHGPVPASGPVKKRPDQGALADPRAAVDEDDHRPAAGHVGQGARQRRQVGLPADERQLAPLRREGGAGRAVAARLRGPQPFENLAGRWPRARVAVEQLGAQQVQVVGRVRGEFPRRRGLVPLLVHQHLKGGAGERQAARQGLVDDDTDAVPVARLRRPQPGRLLRRHVRRGADHLPLCAGLAGAPVRRRDQAEIHQNHAPLACYHHVRRLDVAVQPARLVERRKPAGEPPQRPAEPLTPGRPDCRQGSGGRGGGPPPARGRRWCDGRLREVHRRRRKAPRRRRNVAPCRSRRAAYVVQEAHPVDVLHHDEPLAAVGDELVEGHQIRVGDVQQGAEFLLEPGDRGGVDLPHRLHRDRHPVPEVAGPVDDPHAAAAEDVDHLVPVERRPSRVGPCRVCRRRTGPRSDRRAPGGIGPDRPVDLEEVAERPGEVGESRTVFRERGHLPALFAEDDLIVDQVEQPLGVVAECRVAGDVVLDAERFAA